MLVTKHMNQRFKLFDVQFAVGGLQCNEFATGELLRSATLVHVNVRGLCTNHRVIRFGDRFEPECVCACAAEHEENFDVFAEMFLNSLTTRAVTSSSPYATT